MIVTRTPLRISLAGGGSDFAGYYRNHGGSVLSTAIDKYVHVILQSRFDDSIRVGYSTTELAESLDEVRHELVRESMRTVGVAKGIEISTMADVPGAGTGLGSSSAVTVGLLNALHHYTGTPQTNEALAREAVQIEVGALGKPIGKQDQYIAAYGGLRRIVFLADDTVEVHPVDVPADVIRTLNDELLLFYTGHGRDSATVLTEQRSRIGENLRALHRMVAVVGEMEQVLLEADLAAFGQLLHECWMLKRGLASTISNAHIDELYNKAREAGALGGKITGAGGGGFLMLHCPTHVQTDVRSALAELRELPCRFVSRGTAVVFSS